MIKMIIIINEQNNKRIIYHKLQYIQDHLSTRGSGQISNNPQTHWLHSKLSCQ